MSEPSKRDRAAESLGRLFRRASRCVGPEPGDVEALVDLLIDAARGVDRPMACPPGSNPGCPKCGSIDLRSHDDGSWTCRDCFHRGISGRPEEVG